MRTSVTKTTDSAPLTMSSPATSGEDIRPDSWTHLHESLMVRADFTRGQKNEIVQYEQIKFRYLTGQWHEERGISSSTTEVSACPSYQKIIAMGKNVMPLILNKLESEGDEPDMWFWALRVISDEDPVAEKDRGNVKAMAAAWLRWGREQYDW